MRVQWNYVMEMLNMSGIAWGASVTSDGVKFSWGVGQEGTAKIKDGQLCIKLKEEEMLFDYTDDADISKRILHTIKEGQ